jgi:hypothetical protein
MNNERFHPGFPRISIATKSMFENSRLRISAQKPFPFNGGRERGAGISSPGKEREANLSKERFSSRAHLSKGWGDRSMYSDAELESLNPRTLYLANQQQLWIEALFFGIVAIETDGYFFLYTSLQNFHFTSSADMAIEEIRS